MWFSNLAQSVVDEVDYTSEVEKWGRFIYIIMWLENLPQSEVLPSRAGRSERTIHKYRQNDEGSVEVAHRANEANLIRAILELAAPTRLDQTLSHTEQF